MANSVRRRSSKKGSKKAASKRSHKSSPPKRKASAKKGKSKRKKKRKTKRTVKVKTHRGGMVGGAPALTKNITIELTENTLLTEIEYNVLKLSDTLTDYTKILSEDEIWNHVTNNGIRIQDFVIKAIIAPVTDAGDPVKMKTDGSEPMAKIVSVTHIKDSSKEVKQVLQFNGLEVT